MEKLIIFLLLFFAVFCSNASDTLLVTETVRDGDSLVSANEMFELAFFPLGSNRYLGIRYKNISNGTVVWVANRDAPLNTTSGTVKLSSSGILQLFSEGNTSIWSSSLVSSTNITTPVAQLLDNGNLVIRHESINNETFVWQSFDYPGDTYLPGMKIGKDLVTGIDRRWISWKSLTDPSSGQYVGWMDTNGFPQLFLGRGSVLHTRFGPWNGLRFSGMPSLNRNPTSVNEFVFNDKEIYYRFQVDSSVVSRMYLNPVGGVTRMNWVESTQTWLPILTSIPVDSCTPYGLCGPFGTCNTRTFPVCSCMEGFQPKNLEKWDSGDWADGCVRKTDLDCENGDGFRKTTRVKIPDTRNSWYNVSMGLGECEIACRVNCSCTAYADLDIRNGGSGCLLWFDELMDVREYEETQNLYVRMAVSELTGLTTGDDSGSTKKNKMIISVVSTLVGLLVAGLILAIYTRSKRKRSNTKTLDADLPSFSLSKISKSTSNFSIANKLGEGGFGPVYKGLLEDGREIAVKRLSKSSAQGLNEFKNEILCIAKLQHRNLVKLLGHCIQGDETMLIYEYMANKSLDLFIFDENRSSMLDWPQRFNIIHGIARGLLYLHQDSRLRVIHRDLKAANILLDDEMNPKISDFGLARRFKGFQTEANTNKVVGTYGYISPEYAVHGLFSVKSDVFSFGVLVLEIVSGKKNRGFSREEHSDNLLGHDFTVCTNQPKKRKLSPILTMHHVLIYSGHVSPNLKAWRLYKEDRSLELASSQVTDTRFHSQLLRSIHIGLLCVQHHSEDRPTMSYVVGMLDNESALPAPKQPAFFTEVSSPENDANPLIPTENSVDNVTITVLDGR